MALKIEEAMDMSLDDYIEMSKKSNEGGSTTRSNKNSALSSANNDAKFGRRRIPDEDEEEDDLSMINGDGLPKDSTTSTMYETGIWKGPDSSMSYLDCSNKQNDLRDRLKSKQNNNKNHTQQLSAIQYRLMAPNTSADRPRGLPTLLPLDAIIKRQNISYNNFNNRNRGRGSHYRNRGRMNNTFNNYNNNTNNNGNFGRNGMVNNGRIQRNRGQNMNKNMRLTINGNESMFSHVQNKNMVVECPSDSINLNSGHQFKFGLQQPSTASDDIHNRGMPIGNLTPQAKAVLNLEGNSNQISSGSDSVKDLLGFQGNLAGDTMPIFAARLLDLLGRNVQPPTHKPVYDMKLQKDIHEIQNKPLVYKCPGGDVVSSDGAGVDCQIIPRTSGISMNCRFA
ncbi:probable serine/threonine-protein kinase clkA [Stomoxys calcitrans]|uniref:probable serine/threonine-protein kinase clkA n=1 Tax=Stomoxys calcitrans TaxID=35570 RepID=UPI0027E252E2|nr:probable serine/threonine-protein kinase clkA [Stomoxys calcitrans]